MVNAPTLSFGIPDSVSLSRLMEKGMMALLIATALLFTSPAWSAGEDEIAVIYPDIGEPYHSIFEQIIQGIAGFVG